MYQRVYNLGYIVVWWLAPFCVESGFLPPPKNMHARLIGDSKLTLGMTVSVVGCFSLCGPVMDWRPVQGVQCLLPIDRCDSLQPLFSVMIKDARKHCTAS